MFDNPKMQTWIGMLAASVGLLSLTYIVNGLSPTLLDQKMLVGGSMSCLAGLAIVLLLGAIASFLNWMAYEANQREAERKNTETITPRLMELRAAAALTPEQIKVVPYMTAQAEIDMVAQGEERAYFLRCPGGSVPLEWAIDYLLQCGVTELIPIRTYSDGSRNRIFAKLMTEWCVHMGYATPAEGNQPALWIVTGHSKQQALRKIGWEEDAD